MSYIVEDDGTVKITQGDSVRVPFYEIPTDKDYLFSFSIFDSSRRIVWETSSQTNMKDYLFIEIPAEVTDKFTVFKSYKFQIYYYGVKLSDTATGGEDTSTVNNKDYGSLNRFIVYPKQAEGLING